MKSELENRFKVISIIVLTLFVLTFLLFKAEDNFFLINYFISFAVWGWLIFDYKILQINKLYFSSVGIGLLIFLYGLFLNGKFEEKIPIMQAATTMPIFLLIIQRPLRIAFIKVLKREPKVEKPAPSFADFLYALILWMLTSLIPIIYFKS